MMRRIAAGLFLSLWSSLAFGQGVPYFPQVIPVNTVLGRLSSNPGPVEAIPFATFTSSLLTNACLLGSSTGCTTFASANASITNYVITFPAATGTVPLVGGNQTWTGSNFFNNASLAILGTSTGYTVLSPSNSTATNYTLTLPSVNDTLVGLAATQVLTNKTLTSPALGGTVTGANTIPLSILAQVATKAVLGNGTSGTANVTAAWTVANTTDTVIPLYHGSATSGDIVCNNDTAGTLKDCGITFAVGSFTPTFLGSSGAGTPTYTLQAGSYEQIGRSIVARFNVAVSNLGGATGNLQISLGALPVAANTASDNGACYFYEQVGATNDAGFTTFMGFISPAANVVQIVENGSGVASQVVAVGKFAATTQISGICSYHT